MGLPLVYARAGHVSFPRRESCGLRLGKHTEQTESSDKWLYVALPHEKPRRAEGGKTTQP